MLPVLTRQCDPLRESALVARSASVARDGAVAAPVHAAARPHQVLMIAFYYPPNNSSSGGLRPLKFGKYLPEFGWQSGVLTVPTWCHESTDDALLEQIPAGVRVHRAFGFDTKRFLAIRARYFGFMAVPDRYVSWLPAGALAAVRAVRRDQVSALFSTSPVPTAHLIALAAKSMTGTPWIADFRDPWVETEGPEVRKPVRQAVETWLERLVVSHADRVVTTTPEFADYLRQRYGDVAAGKFRAVYNGYDEDDFRALEAPQREHQRFTLVHAGLLDARYRSPEPVLRALRQCLDRGVVCEHQVAIQIIGGGEFVASGALARLIADLRLQSAVQTIDRMPYRQALGALAAASALLLIQSGDDTRTLIPAKAFEYLRIGRPILAAAPADSATARLIGEFTGGFVAEPGDPNDIASKLGAMLRAWSDGVRWIDRRAEGLDRYDRRAAARKLAGILNEIIADAPGAARRERRR